MVGTWSGDYFSSTFHVALHFKNACENLYYGSSILGSNEMSCGRNRRMNRGRVSLLSYNHFQPVLLSFWMLDCLLPVAFSGLLFCRKNIYSQPILFVLNACLFAPQLLSWVSWLMRLHIRKLWCTKLLFLLRAGTWEKIVLVTLIVNNFRSTGHIVVVRSSHLAKLVSW